MVQHTTPPIAAGQLLRQLRLEARLTLQALGQRVGLSKPYLSLIENGRRPLAPEMAARIEDALGLAARPLSSAVEWSMVSPAIRDSIRVNVERSAALQRELKRALGASDPVADLKRLLHVREQEPQTPANMNVNGPFEMASVVGRPIPVINKVAAGYPREFTDLDYPAAVADEYVRCPDVDDADAFAARVVGDSMEPEYHEGDIVVFSPRLPTPSGADCFVRLERDNESTFKRVFIEDEGRTIRLQPLNGKYPVRRIEREGVAGMYAAAYVMRPVSAIRTA